MVVASGKKLDDGNNNNKVDAVGVNNIEIVGFGKNLEVDTIGKKVEGSGKKFDDRNSNNKVDSVGVKNININNKVDAVGGKNMEIVVCGKNCGVDTIGKKVVGSGKKLDVGNSNNKVDAVGGKNMDIVGCGKNCEVDTIGKKFYVGNTMDNDIVANCTTVGIFESKNAPNKIVGKNDIDAEDKEMTDVVTKMEMVSVENVVIDLVDEENDNNDNNNIWDTDPINISNKPIFLHEPCRANLNITKNTVQSLDGEFMLDTTLIDYLIKCGIDGEGREESIVTTSAVENLIDYLLQRADKEKDWYQEKRREYQYYSLKPFNIYICACTNLHFFLVNLI